MNDNVKVDDLLTVLVRGMLTAYVLEHGGEPDETSDTIPLTTVVGMTASRWLYEMDKEWFSEMEHIMYEGDAEAIKDHVMDIVGTLEAYATLPERSEAS